jgi:hypothetical protein
VKVEDGAGDGGEFGRLGAHETVVITDMDSAVRSLSCPDVMLLLDDAMANRADLLLGDVRSGPGLVRMGDSWVPRMNEGSGMHGAARALLPGIHLRCFVRATHLMATLTVKMKRFQHLDDADTLGARVFGEQRNPASAVEVVISPYGVAGLLKSARSSQLVSYEDMVSPESKKEVQESGWAEFEAGQLAVRDASRCTTMCKSKMVVVEVEGDARLYPAHRLVRLSRSPVPLVPHLDNIWLDLPDDVGPDSINESPEKREQRDKFMATTALRHMYAMLRSGARGSYGRLPYLPPLNGYWVFARIPPQCIKLLLKDKPLKPVGDAALAAAVPAEDAAQASSFSKGCSVLNSCSKFTRALTVEIFLPAQANPTSDMPAHGAAAAQQHMPSLDSAAQDSQATVDARSSGPGGAVAANKKGQKRKGGAAGAAAGPAAAVAAAPAPAPASKRSKKGKAAQAAAAAAAAATISTRGQGDANHDDDGELLLTGGSSAAETAFGKKPNSVCVSLYLHRVSCSPYFLFTWLPSAKVVPAFFRSLLMLLRAARPNNHPLYYPSDLCWPSGDTCPHRGNYLPTEEWCSSVGCAAPISILQSDGNSGRH